MRGILQNQNAGTGGSRAGTEEGSQGGSFPPLYPARSGEIRVNPARLGSLQQQVSINRGPVSVRIHAARIVLMGV